MNSPPIPRLVNLVRHALNGVVVEQFVKIVEDLLGDLILLWRLLKLLFEILHKLRIQLLITSNLKTLFTFDSSFSGLFSAVCMGSQSMTQISTVPVTVIILSCIVLISGGVSFSGKHE